MSETPHLLTVPRVEPSIARTVWDDEAALLRTSFEYPKQPHPSPSTLAEHLNQDFGIQSAPPRALLGDVEMVFLDDQRLESIELRTNVSNWPRTQIGDLPASLPEVWINLDVAYDSNRIYTVDLDVSIRWDPVKTSAVLRFDQSAITQRWLRLADTIAVGVSSDGALVELRLDDLEVMPGVEA
jgi:hypothetical protein